MNKCKHGVILYGFCKHCIDDISDKAVIDQESGKRIAIDSIKQQPYFKRSDIGALTARWAAVELMCHANRLKFHTHWPQRVRSQPFFGVDSSLPTTIKFRRPVQSLAQRVIDIGEISDRTAKHSQPVIWGEPITEDLIWGMDMGEQPSKTVKDQIIDKCEEIGINQIDVMRQEDVDFWWGNGKAWPTEKEWGERNIKGATQ